MNETWAQWRKHCSHECGEALEDMAEAGAAATMETWPTARRVEVARDVLAAAGVPDLLAEVGRLRTLVRWLFDQGPLGARIVGPAVIVDCGDAFEEPVPLELEPTLLAALEEDA